MSDHQLSLGSYRGQQLRNRINEAQCERQTIGVSPPETMQHLPALNLFLLPVFHNFRQTCEGMRGTGGASGRRLQYQGPEKMHLKSCQCRWMGAL